MIEAGKTVELSDAVFDMDLQLLVFGAATVELLDCGLQSLQAAVERRAVDDIHGRIQCRNVLGQFLGLVDSMSCQCRIRSDASRCGEVACVCSSSRVNHPVRAELISWSVCLLQARTMWIVQGNIITNAATSFCNDGRKTKSTCQMKHDASRLFAHCSFFVLMRKGKCAGRS